MELQAAEQMKNGIKVSVIVPLYNEEECIRPLHAAVVGTMDPQGLPYEILFVDDGSRDRTFQYGKELALQDPRLRLIRFRRNCGQTPAMAAGIDHARGEVLITMDGDLQNDPSDIPELLKRIEEGSDIVCGWRHDRKDKLISRKIPSVVANRIIGWITGVPIKDNGCSLKAYRANVIKSIPLYSDMHRFIPAMTSIAGTVVSEVKVKHHPRKFGVSKYGISRIYKVIIDLLIIKTLIAFAGRPIRLFGTAGVIAMILGAGLFYRSVTGFQSGAIDMDFMIASSALLLGILSIYLVSIGLLCELVCNVGKSKDFSQVKIRVE